MTRGLEGETICTPTQTVQRKGVEVEEDEVPKAFHLHLLIP